MGNFTFLRDNRAFTHDGWVDIDCLGGELQGFRVSAPHRVIHSVICSINSRNM